MLSRNSRLGNGAIAILATLLIVGNSIAVSAQQFGHLGGSIITKDISGGPLMVEYRLDCSINGSIGSFYATITPTKSPSSRDRNLVITYHMLTREAPDVTSANYHRSVTLPQGSTGIDVEFPVFLMSGNDGPGQQTGITWDVSVFEDGKDIEFLQASAAGPSVATIARTMPNQSDDDIFHSLAQAVNTQSLLWLTDDPASLITLQGPIARVLASMNQPAHLALQMAAEATFQFEAEGVSCNSGRNVFVRTTTDAPKYWYYYTQFSYVFIPVKLISTFQSTNQELGESLKTFVASGGNLFVLGDPTESRRLVDEWLDGKNPKADQGKGDFTSEPDEWVRAADVISRQWWWRDLEGVPVPEEESNTTSQYGLPAGPGLVPVSGITVSPSGQVTPTLPATASNIPELRNVTRPPDQVSRPLSIAGVLHDALILIDTDVFVRFDTIGMLANESSEIFSLDEMARAGFAPNATSSRVRNVWPDMDEPFLMDYLKPRVNSLLKSLDLHDVQATECARRSHLLGTVSVLTDDLTIISIEKLRAALQFRAQTIHYGTNAAMDGIWSLRNMIDTVGRPPVWMFCTIVLLFGLLLGPGLLMLTGWIGRRSLLIFFVPATSLIATLLILVYAIFHEGFDTSTRVSSVTAIDGRTGEAFVWSRQTYFSGWPPPEGLVFPKDVYFRPVLPLYQYGDQRRMTPRANAMTNIFVEDDQMKWIDWLRAREQQQLLIGQRIKAQSPVHYVSSTSTSVTIENVSGEDLPVVVVRGADEDYYVWENLRPGETVTAQRITRQAAGPAISRYRADYIPAPPDDGNFLPTFASRRRRFGAISQATRTQEILDELWATSLSEEIQLAPRSFSTLVGTPPEFPQPIQATHPLQSKNKSNRKQLVVGRLDW